MKHKVFKLLLHATFIAMLIVPAVGAIDKKAESGKVQVIDMTTAPQTTPERSVEPSTAAANKDPNAGEEIKWQVISSGGTINSSSSNFRLSTTVGQTAVGTGSSANYGLSHGFWQEFGPSECDCLPADANNDDAHNVADAVYIINYVFKNGPTPIPYETCSGDAQADCGCNVADAVYLINYVFKNGPAPCTCEEWVSACGAP